jgi:hypothetical protein
MSIQFLPAGACWLSPLLLFLLLLLPHNPVSAVRCCSSKAFNRVSFSKLQAGPFLTIPKRAGNPGNRRLYQRNPSSENADNQRLVERSTSRFWQRCHGKRKVKAKWHEKQTPIRTRSREERWTQKNSNFHLIGIRLSNVVRFSGRL